MAAVTKKTVPPYATYKSFSNFINNLRDNGMPKHITKSMLPGSNSGKAAMAATLASLGLVNAKDEPTDLMMQLADPEENFGDVMGLIIERSYPFMTDGSLDIANTTTDKVVEKFKELGAGGSTITKCMAFFLSAASDAKITVSRWVKTPAVTPKPTKKKIARPSPLSVDEVEDEVEEDRYPADKERIVVSVHGMDEWEIFVPKGLTLSQWKHGLKMAMFILDNYRSAEETKLEDVP